MGGHPVLGKTTTTQCDEAKVQKLVESWTVIQDLLPFLKNWRLHHIVGKHLPDTRK